VTRPQEDRWRRAALKDEPLMALASRLCAAALPPRARAARWLVVACAAARQADRNGALPPRVASRVARRCAAAARLLDDPAAAAYDECQQPFASALRVAEFALARASECARAVVAPHRGAALWEALHEAAEGVAQASGGILVAPRPRWARRETPPPVGELLDALRAAGSDAAALDAAVAAADACAQLGRAAAALRSSSDTAGDHAAAWLDAARNRGEVALAYLYADALAVEREAGDAAAGGDHAAA
jgi:hypothetical protein